MDDSAKVHTSRYRFAARSGGVLFAVALCLGGCFREMANPLYSYYKSLEEAERILPSRLAPTIWALFEPYPDRACKSQSLCMVLDSAVRGYRLIAGKESDVLMACSCQPVIASRVVMEFWQRTNRPWSAIAFAVTVDAVQLRFTEEQLASLFAHFYSHRRSLSEASLDRLNLPIERVDTSQFLTLLAIEEIWPDSDGPLTELNDVAPGSEWKTQLIRERVEYLQLRLGADAK